MTARAGAALGLGDFERGRGEVDAGLREVVRVRAFRRYLIGHFVSLSGNAMQQVGLAWVVIELTGSGTALGAVVLLNYLPAFLIAPFGGVLADRIDRRRGVLVSQALLGMVAVLLTVLTFTGLITLWAVYAIAFVNGSIQVVDMPLRQVLVHELVSDRGLHRAISITTSIGHASRTLGPGIAGFLIVAGGTGSVFMVNAVTFLAVIVSLLTIRPSELHRVPPSPRARGQIREGVLLIWNSPLLRVTFIVMFVVGTFGFSFNVVLPLIASVSHEGGAAGYGMMAAAMGLGSVVGALLGGTMARPGPWRLATTSGAYGLAAIAVAAMPNLTAATLVVVFYGIGNVFFVTTCNVAVQLNVPPTARGRVMALYGVLFWGSMAVGGPIAGTLSDRWSPRWYMAASGMAMIGIGSVLGLTVRGHKGHRPVVSAHDPPSSAGALR